METIYYAASGAPLVLTLSTEPEMSMYSVMLWNIMRMILMCEGDECRDSMDAESALETLDGMSMENFKSLKKRAESEFADWDFQAYLDRKGIDLNSLKLEPIEELFKDDETGELPLKEEAEAILMEILNEYDWQGFCLWEMPSSEWD